MTRLACAACLIVGDGADQALAADDPAGAPTVVARPLTARFDSREIKTTAKPGADVVEFHFEFTNTGETPLAVEEFRQACGCMSANWNNVPVPPGAKGDITARLLTKGLRGKVRKSVHVKFFEAGAVELVGEVEIPEALTYSAQSLRWTVGGAAEPKQVDIAVTTTPPVRVLSVTANDPAFSCELQSVDTTGGYRIVVTPHDTAAARVCVLQVRTDSKDPRDALRGLFALIENGRPEGVRP
ncbi:MAG: DUF1573 domain-containing protein [Verrucomicrobiota bacterium]